MSTLLGIDIGGTAVKIGVVDENGKVLLSETRSVSFDGYEPCGRSSRKEPRENRGHRRFGNGAD